jgi:hypothetical protein
VSLAGWTLTDEVDRAPFVFDTKTVIPANGQVVIAREPVDFGHVFPGVTPLGPMMFGLGNGGDHVFLYDALGALVDHVEFDDKEPWPSGPDGDGFTLQRIGDNWVASAKLLGTPGMPNGAALDQVRLALASPALDAEGNLALKVTGAGAGGYAVESSANLRQWAPVEGTVVAGDRLLIPLNAKPDIRRFFRLKKNP